jgi:hypothetical protein
MGDHNEIIVRVNTSKLRHAVAVAEDGWNGKIRCFSEDRLYPGIGQEAVS